MRNIVNTDKLERIVEPDYKNQNKHEGKLVHSRQDNFNNNEKDITNNNYTEAIDRS